MDKKGLNMKSRKELIAAQREHVPENCLKIYDKAMEGKSLRAAVNARCLDCCAWQKAEVHKYPAMACPLWSVRPYQRRQKAVESVRPPNKGQFRKEKASVA